MNTPDRESIGDPPNPLGLDGIEYVEYTTTQPQALGQVLETMGFKPVARHRSREVLLYRQGGMNIVVNAHAGVLRGTAATDAGTPRISAVALRVRDARATYERALALGAWDVPMHAQVMELNIPGIHGPGGAHIYFVDRYREFSIYSVDFTPIPGVDPQPPAQQGLHWFGIVQYIGRDRTEDWVAFYQQLLVEGHPVFGAVAADVLHDGAVVQPLLRRRLRVHAGDGREVHAVDGKLAVAVHKVDVRTARCRGCRGC